MYNLLIKKMTERRRMYDDAHLKDAVKRCIEGEEKIMDVHIAMKIPYSTLKKYVSKHHKGDTTIEKKQEENHTLRKNVKIPLLIGLSECKEQDILFQDIKFYSKQMNLINPYIEIPGSLKNWVKDGTKDL